MTRGFTLLELLIAISILAILAAISAPRLARPLDRFVVDRAARELAAAHGRARMRAVVESRVSLLVITPDSLVLSVLADRDTLIRWRASGPRKAGVSLTGPSRPLRFLPSGVAYGVSNATFELSRGATTRRVVVSRWGRVRIQ